MRIQSRAPSTAAGEYPFRSNEQDWMVSWHTPRRAPEGTAHGSAGICLAPGEEVVMVSSDGLHWDFPAGRTEGVESWEETLRREVREEACARLLEARLLGFSHGRCVRGKQVGEVLVRAFWRAEVVLEPWEPRFEIRQRRQVPRRELVAALEAEGERLPMPIYRQALEVAGLV